METQATTVQTIVLLRHARAGDRDAWEGDDALRPLTRGGERQAQALGERLAAVGLTSVLSSPYRRCRQTVQPLADRVGLTVESHAALQEGSPLEAILNLVDTIPGNAVLCSHGDVIGALLECLVAQGVLSPPLPSTEKGAYWLIERDRRRFLSARLHPAP